MRYELRKFGPPYPFIRDLVGGRAHAYGPTFDYSQFNGSHRRSYTQDDAQAVADWLNERAAGYPFCYPGLPTI